jgi:hypothetical protein
MRILYRISDVGYNKIKPLYINNENCLKNALKIFPYQLCDWLIIADNVSKKTSYMIEGYIPKKYIHYVSIGHGAGTFNLALDKALQYGDDEIVYFIENDYLHLEGSSQTLGDGFNLGADYMTLYLHPDKFIPPNQGGNPEVDEQGGYQTILYKGEHNLFFQVNSTTMTFASKVKTLKEDESILRKWTQGTYPQDFNMFLDLRAHGKVLLCPVNTKSTHGETKYLAPFIDWSKL